MKNNLVEIGKRFLQLKSELQHSGYTGEFLENHLIDAISDEVLSEIGEIERYEEVKSLLMNMFFLGSLQSSNISESFYNYDKLGVRAFVRYSIANGGWAIECYRKKRKDELLNDNRDWEMIREGHIRSYETRELAEEKVLELAKQICLENNF